MIGSMGVGVGVDDYGMPSAGDVHPAKPSSSTFEQKININLVKAALESLLQFISTIVTNSPRLKNNASLLYALIQQHESILPLLSKLHEYAELTNPIVAIVQHYLMCIETGLGGANLDEIAREGLNEQSADRNQNNGERFFTAKEALAFLKSRIDSTEGSTVNLHGLDIEQHGFQTAGINMYSGKYFYRETENSKDFFVPYIWTLTVISALVLHINHHKVQL